MSDKQTKDFAIEAAEAEDISDDILSLLYTLNVPTAKIEAAALHLLGGLLGRETECSDLAEAVENACKALSEIAAAEHHAMHDAEESLKELRDAIDLDLDDEVKTTTH